MLVVYGVFYVFYFIYLVGYGYSKIEVGGLWLFGVVVEIVVFMLMVWLLLCFLLCDILFVSFVVVVLCFLLMGWGVELVVIMVVV